MALQGIKVIEMAGLAPAPFCGMILADFGAKVIRIDQPKTTSSDRLARGKLSIAVNLKKSEGVAIVRKLCKTADVVIEPFRPGVMERLGLGPKELLDKNPGLIYARLTGYGQTGPLSQRAGHDINYLAITGLLSRLGWRGDLPSPPINLLADFAGGGLMCALGIAMALLNRARTGKGQVIDSNMVDGAAYVGSFVYQMLDSPIFTTKRGEGMLDGGAPFYDTYKTKDGKFMAVGALEAKFYKNFIAGLGLKPEDASQFLDWKVLRKLFEDTFATKTQKDWCEIFDNVDACVTPILTVDEAVGYEHNTSKGTFAEASREKFVPQPAPRFSDMPLNVSNVQPFVGQHTAQVLSELGYSAEEIKKLGKDGVVDQAHPSRV